MSMAISEGQPSGVNPGQKRGIMHRVLAWFSAYRHTRPFWGGLWTALAGFWIIYSMGFGIGIVLTPNWTPSAGKVIGGALILLGLGAWIAPYYKALLGVLAWIVALCAFPAVNAGGYLIGTLLGIFGASMMWGWGAKAGRRAAG